ncbi:MAG: exo-beta-N-acetylmuramidase NamZ family protein [Gemmatimonadaceae bacterium]
MRRFLRPTPSRHELHLLARSTQHAALFLAVFAALSCGTAQTPATDSSPPITSGTVRAAAPPPARPVERGVIPGIEVLLSDSLHLIRGQRVGLITNHSGRDRSGTSSIDLLHRAPGVKLTAIYGPEHGVRGVAAAGEKVASAVDGETGIPVYSLYGETLTPTPGMLANIDVLVYDIQDVGTRAYTYEWTMALAAEAAKKAGKRFIVLDRPNPIRADRIEGGMLDPRHKSFTGLHPVTLRYGLTPGELAHFLARSGLIDADPIIVLMRNYRLSLWWDETGLEWRNPSPNIRDLDAALLYPGTVFFEATNVSEGRGTDAPFKLIGAAWLTDAGAIARELNALRLPGVRFDSTTRRIEAGAKFAGQTIPMIRLTVTDRDAVRPVDIGAHMLRAIYARHPRAFRWRDGSGIERLSGSRALRVAVESGAIEPMLRQWEVEAERFREQVAPFRLYR